MSRELRADIPDWLLLRYLKLRFFSPLFRADRCLAALVLLLLALPGLAQAPAQIQDTSYVLGANDVISISVYGEEDLSLKEVRITDSGVITYPLLGEIEAAGSTIRGLEGLLRLALLEGEILIDPRVTVTIITYRPFYIDGEVEKPGAYPFEPGLTLRKAVSIAGGFTERASRNNVTIHSSEDEDAPQRQSSNLDESIRPGDVITVAQRFF